MLRVKLVVFVCVLSLVIGTVEAAKVVELKFDDGSGSVASDSSGNGNNGTLVNFPTDDSQWITGSDGGALDYDGLDDYVDIGVPVGGDHTYTLIFNVKGYDSLDATNTLYSESKVGAAAALNIRANTGEVQAYQMNNSYGMMFNIISTSKAFDNSNWHEVMLVNNYGDVKLYVDGVVEATATYDPTSHAFTTPTESFLGCKQNAAGTILYHYGGNTDTFVAYDTAVPEPATLGLLGLGGLMLKRRKK